MYGRRRTEAQGGCGRTPPPSARPMRTAGMLPGLLAVAVAVGAVGAPAGASRGPAARRSSPCDGMWHPEPGPTVDGPVRPGARLGVALPADGLGYLCFGSPGGRP